MLTQPFWIAPKKSDRKCTGSDNSPNFRHRNQRLYCFQPLLQNRVKEKIRDDFIRDEISEDSHWPPEPRGTCVAENVRGSKTGFKESRVSRSAPSPTSYRSCAGPDCGSAPQVLRRFRNQRLRTRGLRWATGHREKGNWSSSPAAAPAAPQRAADAWRVAVVGAAEKRG